MPRLLPAAPLPASGFNDPQRDAIRDRGRIYHRHEICRRDKATVGVAPANKRLGARQSAVDQTDLWLIEKLEFILHCSALQFGFELHSRFHLIPDPTLEANVPASLPRLCPSQGEVGVA